MEEVPECARALRLSLGGKIYAAQFLNFNLYIQLQESQSPKVIFLSLLAW
jgi:hypothetical protein